MAADVTTTPAAAPAVGITSTPAYMTADQVAELLQLSPKSIYRLAKDEPSLPMLKIGGAIRFPRERLLRWLADREQGRARTGKQVLSVAKSAPRQEAAGA